MKLNTPASYFANDLVDKDCHLVPRTEIVRRVNLHDDLVRGLQALVEEIDKTALVSHGKTAGVVPSIALQDARNTLAEALKA